jgi:hypothetical protein
MPQFITFSCQKDDIEGSLPLSFMETEKLPEIPFDSIAISGRSDLFFHHHTQPVISQFVLLKEEGEMFGLDSLSCPYDLPELQGMVDPLFLSKPQSPLHLNGQLFPPLCSPSLQNFPAAFGAHPLQESMGPLPSELAGLIGPLHFFLSL